MLSSYLICDHFRVVYFRITETVDRVEGNLANCNAGAMVRACPTFNIRLYSDTTNAQIDLSDGDCRNRM